jgi:hypothetical protein
VYDSHVAPAQAMALCLGYMQRDAEEEEGAVETFLPGMI